MTRITEIAIKRIMNNEHEIHEITERAMQERAIQEIAERTMREIKMQDLLYQGLVSRREASQNSYQE